MLKEEGRESREDRKAIGGRYIILSILYIITIVTVFYVLFFLTLCFVLFFLSKVIRFNQCLR